jgi:hypothetical protein
LRALLRASVFFFAFSFPYLIFSLLVPGPQVVELTRQGGSTPWTNIAVSALLPCGLVALLFSNARRCNGFAGLHELLSKTRTVLRSAHDDRPLTQVAREIVVSQPAPRRVGPYEVLGSLAANQEHELLTGYDENLRRKVWIRLVPVGSPAVTTRRRDLSRAGRLRWLSGKRTVEDSWDAYEATDGKPLLAFLGEAQPWRIVRHWLHDLGEELHASLKDESAADLGLDRVWITTGGRAKLLEWRAPGLDLSLEESLLTAHEPFNFESGQRFLYRVALCALQGCMNEPRKIQTDLADNPLPLPATTFLKKLGAQGFQRSQLMMDSLVSLVQTAAVVPRWKRSVQLALCISYPLLQVVLMGSTFLMVLQFRPEHPDSFVYNVNVWGRSYRGTPLEMLAVVPALFALFPGLVLGLLSGLLFRGGLVLRWLGISVVNKSGAEVSRLRGLWRTVVAWSPAGAAVVIAMLWIFSSYDFLPVIVMPLAGGLTGIVWAVVNPERGLQDKVAGTYLVPR